MIRDDFLPIPDPGVKKGQDPGSGSATLEVNILFLFSFTIIWLFQDPLVQSGKAATRIRR
jgi:hypothetical protein